MAVVITLGSGFSLDVEQDAAGDVTAITVVNTTGRAHVVRISDGTRAATTARAGRLAFTAGQRVRVFRDDTIEVNATMSATLA